MNTPFLDLLRSGKAFMLSGHEHPDGDCVGSQVGLYHLLKGIGNQVSICNPDPVARSLSFLEQRTPIGNYKSSGALPESDVVVLLDCAHLSRLGAMEESVRERDAQIAVIDHHVGSEHGDGTLNWIDVEAAATGILVYDLYKALDVEISSTAAEALFVSVVSDTGWFRYSNTDSRAMLVAEEMIRLGAEPHSIYDRIYRDRDPRSVRLLSESLATTQFRASGRLAFAVLDRTLMMRTNQAGFDTDEVLEPIRSVAGVAVAVLFKELVDRQVKISFRSMGDVDVQAIAADLGGGGHRKAAGVTLGMSLSAAIDAVESRVLAALEREWPT